MSTVIKPRTGSREDALSRLAASFKGAMTAVRRLRGRDTHRHEDLSFAQYSLLFGLAEADQLSAGELAAKADLSPAAATQMLDGLVAKNLVERVRSETDRRVVACSLTEHGRDLVTRRRAHFEARWHAALEDFSAKEIVTAAAVVERLREFYEELDANPAGD